MHVTVTKVSTVDFKLGPVGTGRNRPLANPNPATQEKSPAEAGL